MTDAQVSIADVLSAAAALRASIDMLPDGPPRAALQAQSDALSVLIRRSQLPPGTYVSAGAAAAASGLAVIVGGLGGFLLGGKLEASKHKALTQKAGEASASAVEESPKGKKR
jgi:hypothetical protein